MPLEEGKVKSTDTAEAVGVETLDSAFEGEPSGEQTSPVTTEQAATEQAGINWADYGLPELVGKDAEYAKNFFSFRNRQYGKQANELGELRTFKEKYGPIVEQISGSEGVSAKQAKQEIADMSDVELAMFAQAFNENPYGAMEKFVLPKLESSLEERLFEKLNEKLKPTLEEQAKDLRDEQEWKAFKESTPGYEQHTDVMRLLMTPEYLGDDVPYKDVHSLAVLSKEEPGLFPVTCELMVKGIGFEQAREYASLKHNASADADKKIRQVKDEVKGAAAGSKRATAKTGSSEPDISDMDSAFDLED